jgi:hypothetical protein
MEKDSGAIPASSAFVRLCGNENKMSFVVERCLQLLTEGARSVCEGDGGRSSFIELARSPHRPLPPTRPTYFTTNGAFQEVEVKDNDYV